MPLLHGCVRQRAASQQACARWRSGQLRAARTHTHTHTCTLAPRPQGANGAGKTTTFKVVTGQLAPDAGDALVAGASVVAQRGAARRALGYCPQFDGLPAAMTGGALVFWKRDGLEKGRVPQVAR